MEDDGRKCLNSSVQRRFTLILKLDGAPNQDSNKYLTEVFQQRDELEHIGESFTEARILDLILEGLRDEYEPRIFVAKRDPEISPNEIEIIMRNM